MIHIKLVHPVVTMRQIKELADKGLPEKDLMDVNTFWKGFLTKTYEGNAANTLYTADRAGELGIPIGVAAVCAMGSMGICAMAEAYGIAFTPIAEIDIPAEVYWRSSTRAWEDISWHAARVENRNTRLRKLKNMNAPEIILTNETRMLSEYVMHLDDNESYGLPDRRKDGCLRRSLSDVGFHLGYGWEEEIVDKLNNRAAAARKSIESATESQSKEG